MKKIFCLLMVITWVNPGCNKLLDPKPVGTGLVNTLYTDFTGATLAVNGIYQALAEENLYGRNMFLLVDVASDDGRNNAVRGTGPLDPIDEFTFSANNGTISGYWQGNYAAIGRANTLLSRLPSIVFPVSRANYRNQYEGEARFVRALGYFNLVRIFGAVPLVTAEFQSFAELKGVVRTPVDQVYAQIEEDLKVASEKLPLTYNNSGVGNEVGRATRGAAKTMLASVYLTLKRYAEAKALAQEVIASQVYKLAPTYQDNFPARGGTENNSESIFEIQYGTNATSAIGYFMGAGEDGGLRNNRPTDASIVDVSSLFNGLVQAYEPGDTIRKKTTIGKPLQNPASDIFVTVKYFTNTQNNISRTTINYPVYRYAEVLLIYAEASVELGESDPLALNYVNQIRARAGATGDETNLANPFPLYTSLSIEKVRRERRVELAQESKRWFDLVRWGNVLEVMQAHGKAIAPRNVLFPIPQSEINVTPTLTQNIGYN